jgi:DNA-binding XRE family transcriptional regulator
LENKHFGERCVRFFDAVEIGADPSSAAPLVDLAGGRVRTPDDGAERADDVPFEQPVSAPSAEDWGAQESRSQRRRLVSGQHRNREVGERDRPTARRGLRLLDQEPRLLEQGRRRGVDPAVARGGFLTRPRPTTPVIVFAPAPRAGPGGARVTTTAAMLGRDKAPGVGGPVAPTTRSEEEMTIRHSEQSTFGRYLQGLRLRAGLTQARLAEKAGLSPAIVQSLEQGLRANPTLLTLRRLGEAIGMTVADLVGEE